MVLNIPLLCTPLGKVVPKYHPVMETPAPISSPRNSTTPAPAAPPPPLRPKTQWSILVLRILVTIPQMGFCLPVQIPRWLVLLLLPLLLQPLWQLVLLLLLQLPMDSRFQSWQTHQLE
uniref:Uncharacterized protein n=1 Tax=Opuntia streptacantha TaxID=393608 RepID=A0A7C9AMH7_OPUST